jgi:hypothetical protein
MLPTEVAGNVAARPVEACDDAGLDRVAGGREHDRNGRGRGLGGAHRVVPADCSNRRHLESHQLGRERRQPRNVTLRRAVDDRQIAALDKSGFGKALAECGKKARACGGRLSIEQTDHLYRARLLRPCRNRPRRSCAAEAR